MSTPGRSRAITEYSRIEFSSLTATAEARAIEYLLGGPGDLVTGAEGSPNPSFTPAEAPPNVTIERENGRITQIEVMFRYRLDIDRTRGTIRLDVNNGTPQGYQKGFDESKSVVSP